MSESEPLTTWDKLQLREILNKRNSGKELSELERTFFEHEQSEWQQYDNIVVSGAHQFMQVGYALAEIKARKLYLLNDKKVSFVEYLNERMGMSRSQGYRLIETAQLAHDMEIAAKGLPVLSCENQIRALLPLKQVPAKAVEVLNQAKEQAKQEKVQLSAKLIKSVGEKVAPDVYQSAKPTTPKTTRLKKADFKQQMKELLDTGKTQEALQLLSQF